MKVSQSVRRAALALAAAGLGGTAFAQELGFTQFQARALEALGGSVDRIEYTGEGWDACLGQAWKVGEGWARWEITDYKRVIDYPAGESLQSATRRAAMDAGKVGGCGAQPGAAAVPQQSSITPQTRWVDQLPMWLTPHGFLALGDKNGPTVTAERRAYKVTYPVIADGARYELTGHYDRDYLLTRIETKIDDPVFGDMLVEAEFDDYKDFGGVKFPASLVVKQGGHAVLDLAIDGVVPNTQTSAAAPPRPARAGGGGPPAGPAEPPYYEIGDGVFVFSGAYQGVAVELDTFIVLIDGMQSDAKVEEMIGLIRQAIPNKPIRYAVNTHSHFDHASGLRRLAADGAIVLTQAQNVRFFEQALNTPRTLFGGPARAPTAIVQGVDQRYVIADDSGTTVELHKLNGSQHADDMLIAYIPSVKTIVESDLLQPWINPVFGGGREGPHPYLVYLYDELERLGLDYTQFVPIHRPGTPPTMDKAALLEAVGR